MSLQELKSESRGGSEVHIDRRRGLANELLRSFVRASGGFGEGLEEVWRRVLDGGPRKDPQKCEAAIRIVGLIAMAPATLIGRARSDSKENERAPES